MSLPTSRRSEVKENASGTRLTLRCRWLQWRLCGSGRHCSNRRAADRLQRETDRRYTGPGTVHLGRISGERLNIFGSKTFFLCGTVDSHCIQIVRAQLSLHVSIMELSSPIALAKLPRPGGQDGFHFGTVHAVRDGVKKRRKEICAAIDGDSLGLYEVASTLSNVISPSIDNIPDSKWNNSRLLSCTALLEIRRTSLLDLPKVGGLNTSNNLLCHNKREHTN